ncbi:nuclear transport factor 2 family protein [Kitasatospora sp. CMC57]|uniref:Nuclear transport factor 2 family protein n=1 Tax=Kitasatospora sp. CMC57 TaxID=3231513 RepID=A0AB33K5W8_9ACTN
MTVRRIRDRLPVLAACLLLAGVVAASWGGWSWYAAAHDGSADLARARDRALAAGEQAVQNLNTLDHAALTPGLDLWEQSTTGDLHSQLVQGREEFEKQVKQAQSVTTARVLDGAVTELDEGSGQAAVMVAVRITVRTGQEQPVTKDSRMLGRLTRTGEGWKLSALGQAPMGTTASAAQATPSASPAGH